MATIYSDAIEKLKAKESIHLDLDAFRALTMLEKIGIDLFTTVFEMGAQLHDLSKDGTIVSDKFIIMSKEPTHDPKSN